MVVVVSDLCVVEQLWLWLFLAYV